ncbi:MAG: CotH kinase family protein [Bacteroidia bacterium]
MKRIYLFFKIAGFLALYGPAYLFSQTTVGDALFGAPIVHDVYLNFSQTGWWDSLTANYTADIYMRCNMVLDGTALDSVGVKFKGNSSYSNPSCKKSFKIGIDEYDSTKKYDGLTKFNLNNNFKDPSFMREKLMCDFSNQQGMACPRCTYARVYLNNVYWGLYNIVEEVDKHFLKDRFGDKKGNLFKGDPHGDLRWLGSSVSLYYPNYELKTNNTANDWSDLLNLIDKINNSTSTAFHDSLEKIMETTSALRGWALTGIFSDLDSYQGSGHNYYVYDDSITNKFHYILWDVNEAFGNFNMGMTVSQMEALSMFYISNPPANRPLYYKMLANATYKSALVQEYCTMLNYFNNTLIDPVIDSLKNVIATDVQNDTNKFYSYNDFLNNINSTVVAGPFNIIGLKPFIQARNAALTNELASFSCFVGMNENNSRFAFAMYPNPVQSGQFSIECGEEIKTVEIFNSTGNKICDKKFSGRTSCSLSSDGLANGLYFVRVNNASVKKLVISN